MSTTEAQLSFDLKVVGEWLHALSGELEPPLTIRRIGSGQSNLTFLATDIRGHTLILRRPPLGPLLASAHDIAREARIYAALASTAVPVPAIIGYTEDAAITTTPLLAVEHVAGVVVDQRRSQQMSVVQRAATAAAMAPALAAIHAVDIKAHGLADLASSRPYADRQLHRWRTQLQRTPGAQPPLLRELGDRLQASVPPPTQTTLVHGDFHLLNLIFAPDTMQLRAVLDWELATLGDPLADVGTMLAYWPRDRALHFPGFADTRLPGFAEHARLLEAYADLTGRDASAIAFWHSLALWKIAVIVHGIRARTAADPRNASHGPGPDASLPEALATMAATILAGIAP